MLPPKAKLPLKKLQSTKTSKHTEMKTQNKDYKLYVSPVIERVELDNEISLTLDSAPPAGPGEPTGYFPEYYNQDPLKSTVC